MAFLKMFHIKLGKWTFKYFDEIFLYGCLNLFIAQIIFGKLNKWSF